MDRRDFMQSLTAAIAAVVGPPTATALLPAMPKEMTSAQHSVYVQVIRELRTYMKQFLDRKVTPTLREEMTDGVATILQKYDDIRGSGMSMNDGTIDIDLYVVQNEPVDQITVEIKTVKDQL